MIVKDKKSLKKALEIQLDVFSYISPEQRVPQEHPLRSLRAMTDEALQRLQPRFKLYHSLDLRGRRIDKSVTIPCTTTPSIIVSDARGSSRSLLAGALVNKEGDRFYENT